MRQAERRIDPEVDQLIDHGASGWRPGARPRSGLRSLVEVSLRRYAEGDDAQRAGLLDRLALAAASSAEAREALLALVVRHRLALPAIHRLIIDHAQAEDVEQEVLVVLVGALPGFRGDARFTTWLHAIARNTAISAIRRRRLTAPLDAANQPAPGGLSSFVTSSATVRAAVGGLPDPYRQAVLLRDLERCSYAEIAERLDLNLNTVKTRIRRGRALLAHSLGAVVDGG